MAQLPERVLELLRNQAPEAGTDLPSSSVAVFLQELLDRIEELETALGL